MGPEYEWRLRGGSYLKVPIKRGLPGHDRTPVRGAEVPCPSGGYTPAFRIVRSMSKTAEL